jgi:hypothetical protein
VEDAVKVVRELDLDVMTAGVCLPVKGAAEAIEDVRRQGHRSHVVGEIAWRFAEQLVEDMNRRRSDDIEMIT